MFTRNGTKPSDRKDHIGRSAAITTISIFAMLAAAISVATGASAQEEELPGLTAEVTPREWLDPPDDPIERTPLSAMRQKVIIDTYIARDSAFISRPDSFGESVLPRARGPNVNLRTTN